MDVDGRKHDYDEDEVDGNPAADVVVRHLLHVMVVMVKVEDDDSQAQ